MSVRSFLILLVVLAVSAALLTAPAGSATCAETPGGVFEVAGGVVYSGGSGDADSGDDDRWGDSHSWDGDGVDGDGTGTDTGDLDGDGDGAFGSGPDDRTAPHVLGFGLKMFFGSLLVFLGLR